jgi:hypothetical protein
MEADGVPETKYYARWVSFEPLQIFRINSLAKRLGAT